MSITHVASVSPALSSNRRDIVGSGWNQLTSSEAFVV
jgi:hypothetical protein